MFGKGYFNTALLKLQGQEKNRIAKKSRDNIGNIMLKGHFDINDEECYASEDDPQLISNIIGTKSLYVHNTLFTNQQFEFNLPSYFIFGFRGGAFSWLGPPEQGTIWENADSFEINLSNDFTLSLWFNSMDGTSTIIGIGDINNNGMGFRLNNSKLEANFDGSVSVSSRPLLSGWNYIALTKKASSVKFYINGSYVKGSSENIGGEVSGTKKVYVGRSYNSSDEDSYSYAGGLTKVSSLYFYNEEVKNSDLRQNYWATKYRYK